MERGRQELDLAAPRWCSHPQALDFRLSGVQAQSLVPRGRADFALAPHTAKARRFRCGRNESIQVETLINSGALGPIGAGEKVK